ncbi:heme exporter protein CcmD [Pseudoduganella namucuonensis]|uniref:Heme exporter protein D n=1 Tax=Pseudoduganella namucuonensis TaxID=1035707 RepID=A0A1I7M687_9BURK|nr:heme exporter protein CcmD [Pseudoduganella namucuonensis]SFV17445.1 heme exporter protein D [Pseudoduganella namucuonensis]
MNWNSWSEFAAMGGYGAYVWGSFGATALALAGELLLLSRRKRAAVAAARLAASLGAARGRRA